MRIWQKVFPFVILTLPLQLNKVIFTKESLVLGIPIDYRAITIYLTDIVIIAYIIFFFVENRKNLVSVFQKQIIFFVPLISICAYLLTISFFSPTKTISYFFTAKIIEFSFLSLIFASELGKAPTKTHLNNLLIFSLLWQSALVVLQFIKQGSLGLYFLGERAFDTTTSSIAHTQILNSQLLRPYGTFPHPNVLAAFLILTQIIIFNSYLDKKDILKANIQNKAILLISTLAILLTFSKTAFFIESIIIFLLVKNKSRFLILPLVVLTLVNIPSGNIINSLAERIILIQASLDIALKNPLFGVGPLNFINQLSLLNLISIGEVRLLQPVHNVFLLQLAENGILGLTLFAILLLSVRQKLKTTSRYLLFMYLVVYLSVDHFMWTLEQGLFIFFLALAFLHSSRKFSAPDNIKFDV